MPPACCFLRLPHTMRIPASQADDEATEFPCRMDARMPAHGLDQAKNMSSRGRDSEGNADRRGRE
jgi:hypothetical protein